MADLRKETVETYNRACREFAQKFKGIGSRITDINNAFNLAGNPTAARVVEIGCGDGRDAQEIVKRANWYLGFDISGGLLALARKNVPKARFEQADANSYTFPKHLDIVFAFASLLHLNKNEVKDVLGRVHSALKTGGIFYISLKYAPKYIEKIQKDQLGRRQFFYYNPAIIESLAGEGYKNVATTRQIHGQTEWFEIALKKV